MKLNINDSPQPIFSYTKNNYTPKINLIKQEKLKNNCLQTKINDLICLNRNNKGRIWHEVSHTALTMSFYF